MADFQAILDTWMYDRSFGWSDFNMAQNQIDSHDLGGSILPRGMCYCPADGHFYVVDYTGDSVEEYNASWVHQTSHTTDINAYIGICWDGEYFYVNSGSGNGTIKKYDISWTLQETIDISGDVGYYIYALGYFQGYFYVQDALSGSGNGVLKYDASWNLVATYSVYGVRGFTPGDEYLYACTSGNDLKLYNGNMVLQETITIGPTIDGTTWGLARDRAGVLNILDANISGSNPYIKEMEDRPTEITVSGHAQSYGASSTADTRVVAFASAQTSGVIECWMRSTDCTKYSKMILKDGSGNSCITVKIDADKIYAESTDTGLSPADYSWYRFTVDFDCSANTFDLDVDGSSETTGTAFGTNDDGSGLTEVSFVKEDDTFDAHVADIGVDWDADYTEGDNASDDVDITDDVMDATINESLYRTSTATMKFSSTISSYFQAGKTVTFKDLDGTASWKGRIISPEYTLTGKTKSVGKTKLMGMDAQFGNTYRKNFTTARSSDYMLKDIIDTDLTFYHSYDDEIDDFSALTFKYDLKKRIWSFMYFIALLERAVVHYLPDGEIIFNAHDNLTDSGVSWVHGSTARMKIIKYVPNANRHVTRAPVIGAHNSDGQVYVVGTGNDQTEMEGTHGIVEMQPWRDSELTNYSEADQLATNLQAVFSQDTQFITVVTKGKGHIQVGYTIHFSATGVFDIDEGDYLVIKRKWKPTQDVTELVLSDNILPKNKFNVHVINKIYDDEAQAGFEDSDVSEASSDGTVQTLSSVQELRASGVVNYGEFGLEDDLGSDHSYNGVVVELTNSQSFGDAVYISSANTVGQADADATSTMPCIGISVDTNKVLTWGVVRDDSWAWSAGDILYVSTTAGSLTATAPSGSGDQVQVVGIAISSAEVLVIPSMVLVEVA